MNYVTIVTLIHIAVYLFHIGVIPSISDSYRTLKDKRLYHAFFFVFGAMIAAQGAYCPDRMQIPYVFAGFCIFGLSLAAEFWKEDQGFWHVAFTYAGISLGQLLTVLWLWPTWGILSLVPVVALIGGGLLMLKFMKSNVTYWQEVLAVVTCFGPIIFVK
jgi:hypothetical protein